MSIIFNSNTSVTGTANDDIIVVRSQPGTGASVSTSIDAGAGDDVVFSDHDDIFFDDGALNNTIALATNIDNASS